MPMPKSKPVEAGAKPKRKMATSADNAEALLPLALKKTADVGTNSKDRIPRSIRAGLDLPVGAIHRRLRHRCRGNRIHKNTPVFLAKVLEAMIIQAAGDAKKMNKRKRITVESLNLAVAQIWTDVWVHSGIPVPRINLPTGKKSWIGLRSIKQTDMSPTEPYSTTSASIASASASTAVKNDRNGSILFHQLYGPDPEWDTEELNLIESDGSDTTETDPESSNSDVSASDEEGDVNYAPSKATEKASQPLKLRPVSGHLGGVPRNVYPPSIRSKVLLPVPRQKEVVANPPCNTFRTLTLDPIPEPIDVSLELEFDGPPFSPPPPPPSPDEPKSSDSNSSDFYPDFIDLDLGSPLRLPSPFSSQK